MFRVFITSLVFAAALPASAAGQSGAAAAPSFTAIPYELNLVVVPRSGPVGARRSAIVTANHCVGRPAVTFAAGSSNGTVKVPYKSLDTVCGASSQFAVDFAVPAPGRYSLALRNEDDVIVGFAQFDVTDGVPVRAPINITGMWYDPATNGSGISFHIDTAHPETMIGTWFLFGGGVTSWVSIQGGQWSADGKVLEAVALYSPSFSSKEPAQSLTCLGLAPNGAPLSLSGLKLACPARSLGSTIFGTVRMTFSDFNNALIEGFNLNGTPAVSSKLTRLIF